MDINEKYSKLSDELALSFSSSETFLVFANYLVTILNEKSKNSRYSSEDLMNYTYVLEYLRYNPRDEVLILAHTVHSLLFLYQNEGKPNE